MNPKSFRKFSMIKPLCQDILPIRVFRANSTRLCCLPSAKNPKTSSSNFIYFLTFLAKRLSEFSPFGVRRTATDRQLGALMLSLTAKVPGIIRPSQPFRAIHSKPLLFRLVLQIQFRQLALSPSTQPWLDWLNPYDTFLSTTGWLRLPRRI